MSVPALELKGLRKAFGKVEIIRNVNLSIAKGERHALIGPNGAGKSTLFNLISGRFAPSSGQIKLHGEDIAGMESFNINRKGLSRSFQITNIFPKMTVFENIRCALLWPGGYRYSWWQIVNKQKHLTEDADRILDSINLLHRPAIVFRAARAGDRHHGGGRRRRHHAR
jgi:branched-chain amino acid transport system ATP-binding protein